MKRYDIYYDTCMMCYHEDESPNGQWVRGEDAARILAQRDRLAELLDQAHQHCSVNGHCELGEEWFDRVNKELVELDKEKQS